MLSFIRFNSGVLDALLTIIALLMALFIAIPFHEFAHAYAAKREGDYTAVAYKRCTPAFLAHFDLVGFFMMFFFGFGWAKPVPVDSRNFKHGRKSVVKVALAGIFMNLILGVLFLFIYMLIIKINADFYGMSVYGTLLERFLIYSFMYNFGLAIFNILPIYPLDGFRVVEGLSRYENRYTFFMRKFSYVIFILIIITGIYDVYYSYAIENILVGLISLFGKILGI